MKNLFYVVLLLGLVVGCGENQNINTGAYLAGRLGYVGVSEGAKQVMEQDEATKMIDDLEAQYKAFLDSTVAMEIIEPEMSVAFFNELILTCLNYMNDPYFLLSDLTFILSQYGAEFVQNEGDQVKTMSMIQPIPRAAYAAFDIGWHVSKRMMAKN